MPGILDQIARSHAPVLQQFRPATPDHFAALRLAQRLNDAPAVHHYLDLWDRHPQTRLFAAYRYAVKSGTPDLAAAFHGALEQFGKNGNGGPNRDLAAIRVERRAVAVAIFTDTHLKYPPIARQLSSDPDKALGSAAMFIDHIRSKCPFVTAAIETLPADCEAQRSQLTRIVMDVLAEQQVTVWQVAKSEVVTAFGQSPLRFRNEVREVMSAMWPEVNGGFGSPLIKDALALGLFCQTEKLFSLEN